MGKTVLCLFDVDGTLTKPRQNIESEVHRFLLDKLKTKCDVALVGGSDLSKIAEQMGGMSVIEDFTFVFAENGLVAYKNKELIGQENIQKYLGEEELQKFINYCLFYLSQLTLPVKRGTFIEFRTGLINVSPVGRSCSQQERMAFEQYDKIHKIRESFIEKLKENFPDLPLKYSIGGQISFDVFPAGWDKTYCLRYLKEYETIHFFGDKTFEGGNDFELYSSKEVVGHSVKDPSDTIAQLKQLFL